MRKLVILATLVLFGCHRDSSPTTAEPTRDAAALTEPDLCVLMVDHLLDLAAATGKLSFAERMMIRSVKSLVAEQCRKEGVTQAQADCFLRTKTPEEADHLDECPALKAHPLRWLHMGSAPDGGVPLPPRPPKL